MLIRRETLQAVRPATTAEDTRYFLAAIQIEPTGVCVATNGHILIKASEASPMPAEDFPIVPGVPEHTTAPTGPILMSADIADRLCKATPKGPRAMPVLRTVQITTNGDGSSYAAATDLTVPIVVKLTPDGQNFPAYDRVIPKDRPTLAIVLGVPVLEVLIKSAKAIGATSIRLELPTGSECLSKTHGTINTAITATYHGADVEALAVLMPMNL